MAGIVLPAADDPREWIVCLLFALVLAFSTYMTVWKEMAVRGKTQGAEHKSAKALAGRAGSPAPRDAAARDWALNPRLSPPGGGSQQQSYEPPAPDMAQQRPLADPEAGAPHPPAERVVGT